MGGTFSWVREAASIIELEHRASGSLVADTATLWAMFQTKRDTLAHQLWAMSGADNLTSYKLSVSNPWQSGDHKVWERTEVP
jgi:hypothetical protein